MTATRLDPTHFLLLLLFWLIELEQAIGPAATCLQMGYDMIPPIANFTVCFLPVSQLGSCSSCTGDLLCRQTGVALVADSPLAPSLKDCSALGKSGSVNIRTSVGFSFKAVFNSSSTIPSNLSMLSLLAGVIALPFPRWRKTARITAITCGKNTNEKLTL